MAFIVNSGGRVVELPLHRAIKRVQDGSNTFYEGPHPTDPLAPDITAPKMPVKKTPLSAKMKEIRARREKEIAAAEKNMSKEEKAELKKAKKINTKSAENEEDRKEEEQKLFVDMTPEALTADQCKELLDRFGKDYNGREKLESLQKKVSALKDECGV